jgi:hypothetical protein
MDAGWWGDAYYPYHVPYVADYADIRECPSDPTDGRNLCQCQKMTGMSTTAAGAPA